MRLLICGARGSTPAPGPEFVRYGGHTSCIAVGADGQPPNLVLDAGTGLRRLAAHLAATGDPFCGTILLGHLHWDHMMGLPFFRASEHPESRVSVLLPDQPERGDAETLLERAIGPPNFPLRPHELRGRWSFGGLQPGTHTIEGFTVTALDIPHPGGRTFGYRVSDGSVTIAYLSDHSPVTVGPGPAGLGEYHPAALALVEGVDLLIHDSQHLACEFPAKAFLGHSAVEYAVALAERGQAKGVLLFHHDPDRTDGEVDAIVADHRGAGVPVAAAAEGQTIVVGPAPSG